MRIVTAASDVERFRDSRAGTLGLVPTMGALHAGHLSLVTRARSENDEVAVSLFVNPAQFSEAEDLARYPKNLEGDLGLLDSLGVNLVWTPSRDDVYPAGFQTWITVEDVSTPLEGGRRPGHFRGVATVVAKLLNVFGPDRAYFGQKDAQQVAVIKRMVRDLSFPVEVVVCPTVREVDGLALSSRNVHLAPEERRAASVIHSALAAVRAAFDSGERDAGRLRAILSDTLACQPLARADYLSVADAVTLVELERVEGPALVSLAVRFGTTRLIDNIVLGGA